MSLGTTWAWFRVDTPPVNGKAGRWLQYSLPIHDRDRSSADKAAYRRLERFAALNGATIQTLMKPKA